MDSIYDPFWLKRRMDATGVMTGLLSAESGVSRSQIQRIRKGMAPRMDTAAAIQAALARLAARDIHHPPQEIAA